MFAFVNNGSVQSVTGRLPTAARDLVTGEWVCPDGGAWTQAQHEACGWFAVVETVKPAVTSSEVADASVELVDGVPTVVWVVRAKTPEELADDTEDTNQSALWDKARAALTGNKAAITELESFAAGQSSLTNTQRDKALRDIAQHQARVFKELNALIKLEVRDLADTDGT